MAMRNLNGPSRYLNGPNPQAKPENGSYLRANVTNPKWRKIILAINITPSPSPHK